MADGGEMCPLLKDCHMGLGKRKDMSQSCIHRLYNTDYA